ncbi:fibronectin type III domain-containing protein [Chryseobacterium camelliae]|uniref:Fibronectin type III domain-containing protein n=1 Tax=Chryseobacterium camelliae TaxID=1265445 RepID=A0ABY7QRT5_9FLAO|nr:fibronectin type III domain-containing protein [Chryseobacterium camelliae]WBV61888.1 fibronectin type III domain-containing protein [Chryseobacterium camelliae]
MKMIKTKRFLRDLVVLFCMVFGLFAHAQTITIGTGTGTQRQPLGSYYAYEMSASLYTAAEINLPAGGSIQSVAWNSTVAMNFNLPIKIYLKSVPSTTTTLTALPWTTEKTGAVLVYDGTVSNLPTGWNTITLQNQYYYNGTDNLEVLVETNFGGASGGSTSSTGSKITYTTATTKYMYYFSNNAPQVTNGYISSSRPNIRLTFGAPPACIPPSISGLTLSTLTTTSAGISWVAPSATPAGGYDVYYTTSTAMPTSTTTPSQTEPGTTATLSPLTANTTYYAWVRSKCSSSSQSTWTGPLVIYTAYCLPTGGTSSTTSYLSQITTTGGWTNLNYIASSYTAYVDNSSTTLSTSPGSAINVTLKGANTSYYRYYIWVDWNNDMDFNDTGETILATTTSVNTGISTIVNVPAAQPYGNYRVRFAASGSGAIAPCGPAPYGNYVDYNLEIGAPPTCMPPTAVVLNATSTSSASIGWTASTSAPLGYEIYYNTTNIAPGPGTVPQITGVTGTTATIPGLAANTTYYIWVRARCSSSDASPWGGPVTVYTAYCVPSAGTSTTIYYLAQISTTGGWTNLNYTASSYTAYVDNSSTLINTSPGSVINVSLKGANTSYYRYYVWVDWNNDLDFDDAGETILATTTTVNTGVSTVINIPAALPYGTYRVRFATSGSGAITSCGPAPYGSYVDYNLKVEAPPSCLPPTGMSVGSIEGTGAIISWAAPTTLPANGYVYYISTSPTPPAAGATPTGTSMTNSVDLNPTLVPNTTYYWWVRAVCSPTDSSYWAEGPSFMTTQIPAALPYLQNFEGVNDFGLLNGTQTNKWFHGSATGNTGKSIYISNDNGVSNAYTITSTSIVQTYRDIKIPAGTSLATFSFDWKAQGQTTVDYLRVWLVPATFLPTPGTQITTGTGRIQIGQYNQNGAWQSYSNTTLNLTNFAGTVMRLVFEWVNNASTGTQPPAAIDNIVLRVCSTATPVVTVTPASITHNSATITWPQDIGGASYKIRYRPVGSTGGWLPTAGPIDVAAVPGTTQTFTLNAPNNPLTPATLYEVEVAAVCNTINVGVYSHNEFTTKCDPTPPNVTFTNITSTSAVVNWSPIVASATYQMQWRKVGDPGWSLPIDLPNPPANTTYLLSGLTPYTQYEVQVRSTCVGSTTPNPWSSLSRFTTERTCEIPPPGLTILELKPTSAKVQWDPYVGPDATGKYILRYRKVGIPGWTNVPVSTNLYTLTGLTELTKYEMQVANVCSGTPGNYTLPYYFTTPTVIYCQMGANTASGEYISQVTVTPTGKPQMKNPSGASQYTDYTAEPLAQIEMIQGSANNQLTIDKVASGDAGVVAWIDFDRNGEFDINERILVSGPNTAATATATATFSVPSDAFVSNVDYMYVVMRVALMKGGLPVNCTNFDNGEVEDYTVRITKKPTASLLNQTDILIYPNPVSTVLNVKNISKRANYKIYNAAGQLVTKGIILNNKVDVHSLINGVYMIDIEDGSTSVQKKFIKE